MGQDKLLVHPREMGATRRSVHQVRGWQVQPATRVCGVYQPDGHGLREMRSGHCIERGREEYDVRRVPQRDFLWLRRGRHGVYQVPQRDVLARAGGNMHEMPLGMVGIGGRGQVHAMPTGYVPESGGPRGRLSVHCMPRRDGLRSFGESGSSMQRVSPWHVPAERGLHCMPCRILLEIGVCVVQTMPFRDIFDRECDHLHGLRRRIVHRRELQLGMCVLRGGIVR